VHIHLTGGEALLCPDAPEIAAYASELGFFVEFLTNGYWKEQKPLERLARARPSRITLSVDGIGATHDAIRGRDDFWQTTSSSIRKLQNLRKELKLDYSIRLKNVIMAQNLDRADEVAEFAASNDLEVLYQPIEQNYNEPDDSRWYEHSPTWPRDSRKAVATVNRLRELRRQGLPICNSEADFNAMSRYFLDPASEGAIVQAHVAHEGQASCASLGNLQIQPNGDVLTCCKRPPIGNVLDKSIKTIWNERPQWWKGGCCLNAESQ
jgi:MoaA/NifB/PqqE/SkfB family radical SAM enzyme